MYTDIQSYDDACKEQGLDPNNKPDVSNIPEDLKDFITATFEMAVIAKSLNKQDDGTYWEPDFDNDNEDKWFPVFDAESGFALFGSLFTRTNSYVGARLVYRESEISEYAGTQFVDTYRRIHKRA